MANLADTIKTVLENDATFAALATGGVHAEPEISRQDTPTAFDANSEIKPCCLVKLGTITQSAQIRPATRKFIELYFYEYKNAGTDSIDSMADRAYALLHDTRQAGTARVYFDTATPDIPESALSASMRLAVYVADLIR